MFADELERTLETVPLDKVRVVDLCRRCGATPPTFYYHFKDKYDLAAWIYFRDVSAAFGDKDPEYSPERLARSLGLIWERRPFYEEVLTDSSQNSVTSYAMSYMTRMVIDAVRATTGADPTEAQMLEARHHSYGIIGLERDWVSGELAVSAEELAQFLYDHTPAYLQTAFERYAFRRDAILSNAGKTKRANSQV
jgi:AcrR family transcriptional regulator